MDQPYIGYLFAFLGAFWAGFAWFVGSHFFMIVFVVGAVLGLLANATPSPDQRHFPEERSAKHQRAKARHVATGIAAEKIKALGRSPSLGEQRP